MQRSKLRLYLLHCLHAYPITLSFIHSTIVFVSFFIQLLTIPFVRVLLTKQELCSEFFKPDYCLHYLVIFNFKSRELVFCFRNRFFFRDCYIHKNFTVKSVPNLEVYGSRWIIFMVLMSPTAKKQLFPRIQYIFVFALPPRRIYMYWI